MRFIDEVTVFVEAGRGGNGCVAWRRERNASNGGPFGGNGGNGGNIVIVSDKKVHSLIDLYYRPRFVANNGSSGGSNNKTGARGDDLLIRVPVGTVVSDASSNDFIFDFTSDSERLIVCKGGVGGFGNSKFASSKRRSPGFAQEGTRGDVRFLKLNLKLMADVGLLGFPNVGKSTLLSKISLANPKISNYPFTTISVQLGVSNVSETQSMIIADIPGIIKGASAGIGLGIRFLRHLERVRVICHMVSLERTSEKDDESLISKYKTIRSELEKFKPTLSLLPEIVAISKHDLQQDSDAMLISDFKKYLLTNNKKFVDISSVTGFGIKKLVYELWSNLQS